MKQSPFKHAYWYDECSESSYELEMTKLDYRPQFFEFKSVANIKERNYLSDKKNVMSKSVEPELLKLPGNETYGSDNKPADPINLQNYIVSISTF